MDEDAAQPMDEELVARWQAGDQAAAGSLRLRHGPRLVAMMRHLAVSPENAELLLETVFRKAGEAIGGFQGRSSFSTWLHQIGVNLTINHLKKQGSPIPDLGIGLKGSGWNESRWIPE